jgi:L,D-transpeptidase ErfK/SrfK
MKKMILTLLVTTFTCFLFSMNAYAMRYGARLCDSGADVKCMRVQSDDSWESLWPDPQQRDLVMRVNRMNTDLRPGMIIAVPNNLNLDLMSLAPFKQNVGYLGQKQVVVNPSQLAWAAYDSDGTLVRWGPAVAGMSSCPDEGGRNCRTPIGTFTVYDKKGADCVSSEFPVPGGGAHMPYCMHFKGGYALHGSDEVPGSNSSHGCVRMFPEDAAWLNHNFVKVGATKVIIEPYYNPATG